MRRRLLLACALVSCALLAGANTTHAFPDDSTWHESIVNGVKSKGGNYKVMYGPVSTNAKCMSVPFVCATQIHIYGRLKSSVDEFESLMGPQENAPKYVLGWYSIQTRSSGIVKEKPFFFMLYCDASGIRVVEAKQADYSDPEGALLNAKTEYGDGSMGVDTRAIYAETSRAYCGVAR